MKTTNLEYVRNLLAQYQSGDAIYVSHKMLTGLIAELTGGAKPNLLPLAERIADALEISASKLKVKLADGKLMPIQVNAAGVIPLLLGVFNDAPELQTLDQSIDAAAENTALRERVGELMEQRDYQQARRIAAEEHEMRVIAEKRELLALTGNESHSLRVEIESLKAAVIDRQATLELLVGCLVKTEAGHRYTDQQSGRVGECIHGKPLAPFYSFYGGKMNGYPVHDCKGCHTLENIGASAYCVTDQAKPHGEATGVLGAKDQAKRQINHSSLDKLECIHARPLFVAGEPYGHGPAACCNECTAMDETKRCHTAPSNAHVGESGECLHCVPMTEHCAFCANSRIAHTGDRLKEATPQSEERRQCAHGWYMDVRCPVCSYAAGIPDGKRLMPDGSFA